MLLSINLDILHYQRYNYETINLQKFNNVVSIFYDFVEA